MSQHTSGMSYGFRMIGLVIGGLIAYTAYLFGKDPREATDRQLRP